MIGHMMMGRTCGSACDDQTAAARLSGQGPGRPRSEATRRWTSNPHLKTSLEYLSRIFDHLRRHRIDMYRMSSDLAPYVTHPDMPQFHGMIAESAASCARSAGRRGSSISGCPSILPSSWC